MNILFCRILETMSVVGYMVTVNQCSKLAMWHTDQYVYVCRVCITLVLTLPFYMYYLVEGSLLHIYYIKEHK